MDALIKRKTFLSRVAALVALPACLKPRGYSYISKKIWEGSFITDDEWAAYLATIDPQEITVQLKQYSALYAHTDKTDDLYTERA